MNSFSIEDLIRPLPNNLICDSNDELGSVLNNNKDIYSVFFVFDKKQKYLGVISTYQAIFKKLYPFTTKVGNITVKPLLVKKDTPLYKVAQYMWEEGIYRLPVLNDKGEVEGIINAEDIVDKIYKDSDLLSKVSENLSIEPVKTARDDATVKEVYNHFKEKGMFEIVVVDQNGEIEDVVTGNDIKHAFIHPSNKQRFGKNGNPSTDVAFDEEEIKRVDDSIKNYLTFAVTTVNFKLNKSEMIARVNSSEQKTVVLVDSFNKPVGLISIKNVLEALSKQRPEENINLILEKPSNTVRDHEFKYALETLQSFMKKMHERLPLMRVEVTVEEPKYPTKKTAVYNTTLILVPKHGRQYVARASAKTYSHSLKHAMKQIQKQHQVDHRVRTTYDKPSIGENSVIYQYFHELEND